MAFDVEAARKAGYTDAEIAPFLAKSAGFDLAGAKAAGYTDGEIVAQLRAKVSAPAVIPGQEGEAARRAAAQAAPQPSLVDKAIGVGETALSTTTGMTGGAVGMIGGTLKGLAEQILSGKFGTQEAARLVEQSAMQGAEALTYAPRTQTGQEYTQAVGQAMQNLVPVGAVAPTMAPLAARGARAPLNVTARAAAEGTARDVTNAVARPAEIVTRAAPGAMGEAAAAATGAAIDATAKAAGTVKQSATTLPRRALERLRTPQEDTPTPGTMGSVGAAGTDMASIRRATAQNFPVPVRLTKGQASRDPAQLKFEVETAKNPELGAPLRERILDQNAAIYNNFDVWADQTGAQAPSLSAVGTAVDQAMVKMAQRDKAEVRARYAVANKSEEARAIVDPSLRVTVGEGETALTASPISYLNEQPTGLQNTVLTDYARQAAIKLGVADLRDGQLVGKPTTIKQMEAWRREISQATGYEPNDVRNSTILKLLIDTQTEPIAGPLYRQARGARARYAQKYEDHAVISKLLTTKRGTADRQVAFEDVHRHSILQGSLDDVRTVRKTLQTGGDEGKQAWRELQGATLRHIRDEASKNVAPDSRGNRVLSPAALDKTIRELDVDGKLDFIFGKQGAQQMRDLRELAQVAKTVPPEAAINTSNTAATMAAFADVAFSGMTGTPAPVATIARLGVRQIKDANLRKRISDALSEQERKQAPGRVRFKAPPIDPTDGGSAPPSTVH